MNGLKESKWTVPRAKTGRSRWLELEGHTGMVPLVKSGFAWIRVKVKLGLGYKQGSQIRPGRIKSYRIRGRILYDQYEYELKLYGTNTRRYEIRPHCIFSGRIHTRSY